MGFSFMILGLVAFALVLSHTNIDFISVASNKNALSTNFYTLFHFNNKLQFKNNIFVSFNSKIRIEKKKRIKNPLCIYIYVMAKCCF